MATKEQQIQDQVDQDYDPEVQVIGNWKKVDLPEITLQTGEQNDEELHKFRSKIYRFRNGEWKERGVGELKILKNKVSGKVRLLMRAEKTHKVVINHLLQKKAPYCTLEVLKTSNNAWHWAAYDISDEKPQTEKFAGKFTSKEEFERFEKEFNSACDVNEKLVGTQTKQQTSEAKTQTTTVETVAEKKEETKAEDAKTEDTKTEDTKTEDTKASETVPQ